MLVLTRSVGDEIRIGPDIVVKVLEIQGKTVQLGVEAPRDVKVIRPEAKDPKKP